MSSPFSPHPPAALHAAKQQQGREKAQSSHHHIITSSRHHVITSSRHYKGHGAARWGLSEPNSRTALAAARASTRPLLPGPGELRCATVWSLLATSRIFSDQTCGPVPSMPPGPRTCPAAHGSVNAGHAHKGRGDGASCVCVREPRGMRSRCARETEHGREAMAGGGMATAWQARPRVRCY